MVQITKTCQYKIYVYRVPREMTIEEIHDGQKRFVQAVELAILAACDRVEIHAPHSVSFMNFYLLPLTGTFLRIFNVS